MSKCVVIDDDQVIVDLLSECIKNAGHVVLGNGNNGKEAVDLYKKFQPDVVFVDLQMPEYDGIYAIKNIKKLNPHAKIIIVSAHADIYKKLEGLEIFAVIEKPFSLEKIKKSLESL